jgi:hypothetical protein
MKLKWMIVILLLFVVLMVHDPKKTTLEITTGEEAIIGTGGAVLGGLFTAPTHKKAG